MRREAYPEWDTVLNTLVAEGGTVMLLGGTDTGKTSFCTLLLNAAQEEGRAVALVDADVGQSEIGPPGCVGLGLPETPIRTLSEVAPAALAFVGSTSPRGAMLELTTAACAMVQTARERLPASGLLVVDTTGFVRGAAACSLKQAKIRLIAPNHLVVLQRQDECEPLLAPFRQNERITIHRLPVPPVITVKTPAVRAQRRSGRFARYFQEAALHTYNLETVTLCGTWLNTGTPLAPHLLRFLSQALGVRVFYAEEENRHLGIVTDVLPIGEKGMVPIQEQFRPQTVTITPVSRLKYLLCGLADRNGRTLGMGVLETMDFRRHTLSLRTPLRAPGAAHQIQCGLLRVKADGTELGTVRPGEV